MPMLSDDDLDLEGMNDDELARAWDLWFDLAQTTNDVDASYSHGVFVRLADDPGARPPEEDRVPTASPEVASSAGS